MYQINSKDQDEVRRRTAQLLAQNSALVQNQPKKSAGILGDALSIGGGILGSIGGTLVAPIAGTAVGGALGSGAGRALANLITGTDITDNLVADTAFGALGGGVGKALKVGSKVARTGQAATASAKAIGADVPKTGILSRIGQGIEGTGNKLMASQANLTRAQARNLGEPISETFGRLQQRTGLGDINDLTRIGADVTGKTGVVPELVNRSVSPLGIDIGDLSKVAEKSLADRAPSVFGGQKKAIQENVKNSVVKAYGGSEGSLSTVVGGKKALTTSREFADQAATYREAAKRTGSASDKQIASVYQDLSSAINDRLYSAPGAKDLFLRRGKPEVIATFKAAAKDSLNRGAKKDAEAYNRLAEEFQRSVTSVADARTFQKDFVQLSKIAEKTAQAEQGAATQLAGTKSGLGKFAQNPLNIIAEPLNAQSGKVGGVLSKFGRRLQGNPDAATTMLDGGKKVLNRSDLIKSFIAQGVPRALLGGIGGNGSDPLTPEMSDALLGGLDPNQMTEDQLAYANMKSVSDAPVSKEGLDKALLEAATAGDSEGVKTLMSLSEYFYPTSESGGLSNTAQTSLQNNAVASSAVDQLEQILSKTGGQDNGVLATIFGGVQKAAGAVGLNDDARLYDQTSQSLVAALAKSIGGQSGALSDQDIARAQGMLPKLTDSKAVQQKKLQLIRQQLAVGAEAAQSLGAGGSPASAVFGGAY